MGYEWAATRALACAVQSTAAPAEPVVHRIESDIFDCSGRPSYYKPANLL